MAAKIPKYKHALKELTFVNRGHRNRIYARPTRRVDEKGVFRKCYFLYTVRQHRDENGKLHQTRKTLKNDANDFLVIFDTKVKEIEDLEIIKQAVNIRGREIKETNFGNGKVEISETPVLDILEIFIDKKRDRGSDNYWRQYSSLKKHIQGYIRAYSLPVLRFKDLDRPSLENFTDYLYSLIRSSKLNQNTARQMVLCFKVYLHYVEDVYEIQFRLRNWTIKKPENENIKRPSITPAAATKFFTIPYKDQFDKYDVQNFFRFAMLTGLRSAEIRSLEFSDIEEVAFGYKNDTRLVSIAKVTDAKSKRKKRIPLNAEAERIIDLQRDKRSKRNRIFLLPSVGSTSKHLKKWAEIAGVEVESRFGTHSARRFFAEFSNKNMGLGSAQVMLNHANVETTRVYAPVNDEEKIRFMIQNEADLKNEGILKAGKNKKRQN